MTALLNAAGYGHRDIVQLLLAHSADPEVRDSTLGKTALLMAVIDVGLTDVDQREIAGPHVVIGDHHAVVALLIQHGANVNARDYGGRSAMNSTPLIQAAFNVHVDTMRLFLASGAQVDAAGRSGFTALHGIASRPRDVGDTGDFTWTEADLVEAAKLLIKYGADVNARDRWGETPLAKASSEGHRDLARLLRRCGAKP